MLGYQSVDTLSDIDEFEESFKCMSVEDKTRHYYTLFSDITPSNSVNNTPQHHQENVLSKDVLSEAHDEVIVVTSGDKNEEIKLSSCPDTAGKLPIIFKEDISMVNNRGVINSGADSSENKLNSDVQLTLRKNSVEESEVPKSNSNIDKDPRLVSSPKSSAFELDTSPHYNLTNDEPEPIELTHLNMEAAILCLNSKVKSVTGKLSSPNHDKDMDSEKLEENKDRFKIPDVPSRPVVEEGNNFNDIDWAEELRPSMRKLRQGMDSLLKTSRLVCSVLRYRLEFFTFYQTRYDSI